MEQIGQSVEGRSINHVWFGERPDARAAVVADARRRADGHVRPARHPCTYVAGHRPIRRVQRLLDALTIHVVPMLNPDGAQRFQRRNAQGLDINRDALLLQTPEGRTLKALRDRLQPALGFNLHNQSWRTSAGKTEAGVDLAAGRRLRRGANRDAGPRPGEEARARSSADALEPFAPGQVARYDDEFEVRAFGDNVTKWGTPVVLIETGPCRARRPTASWSG